jgi:hypothetical protein
MIMIVNILCVALCRNKRAPSHPKFVSDVKNPDATHTHNHESRRRSVTHIMRLSAESRTSPHLQTEDRENKEQRLA